MRHRKDLAAVVGKREGLIILSVPQTRITERLLGHLDEVLNIRLITTRESVSPDLSQPGKSIAQVS